jgi:hypothetical protein
VDSLPAAALSYVTDRAWSVFPCVPGEKRPLTPNGLKDATTDPTRIRAWWERWPDANIGVACGPSGIVVVDVDNPEGTKTLAGLDYDFPRTLSSVTGSGGAHYFYAMPDPPVRNTAGRLPGVDVDTPGIDCRGDGGYVIVPPSRTVHRYEWLPETWSRTVVPAPSWLRSPIRENGRLRGDIEALLDIQPAGPAYGRKALEAETRRVATALEGTRNHTLVSAAFNLGQLVAAGVLDEYTVTTHLGTAAHSAGLEWREIEETMGNGLEAGKANPRRVAV